jgi:hypothetical protein
MSTHTHTHTHEEHERCFMHGVAAAPYSEENRAAHGSVTLTEVCDCGMSRQVNRNGHHREYGPWENER